jgi:ubiquinone/menaquinone biosynthesis C-methylase UbiE
MINFYEEKIFRPLMKHRLGNQRVQQLRREVLAFAQGEVLEVGIGAGLNLYCYPDHIQSIHAIDVVPLEKASFISAISVLYQTMSAEALTFPERSFDTVVSTFTLCSIPKVKTALKEISRVLKPQGRFLFIEHCKSSNGIMAGMQHLLNPFYNRLACGCNVNRDMAALISESGLTLQEVAMSLYGLPFSGLYFYGIAVKTEDK